MLVRNAYQGDAMCRLCIDSLRPTIDDHGWGVQYVDSDTTPFAYTVGLHGKGHPELLITGLSADVSCRVLNSLAHMIVDDGTALAPAVLIDYQDRFLIEVVEVDHPDVHLKYAVAIFGPLRALQLVWADKRDRFPWEPGWNQERFRQPVFGMRSDWPTSAS